MNDHNMSSATNSRSAPIGRVTLEKTDIELRGSEIEYVVEIVFARMMGTEVKRTEAQLRETESHLTGAVYLTGDWEGAVLLQCSPRQACLFAGRFLSIPPPESVNDEVRDVLGELTNMIAGNLKSSVLKNSSISLPSVVEGATYSLSVRGRSLMTDQRAFSFLGGPFWITLIELWG